MNIENARRCIAVMERVRDSEVHKFDMGTWFNREWEDEHVPTTESQALECGTAACFLGWLALAPEIPEIFVDHNTDYIRNEDGAMYWDALSAFLGIIKFDAERLCGAVGGLPGVDVHPSIAKPQDVIDALNHLIRESENEH